MHSNRGHTEIIARPLRPEPSIAREFYLPVADQTHIKGGAAGIAHNHIIREPFRLHIGEPGNRRHRRTGFHEVDRTFNHLGQMHHATERSADQNVVAKTRGAQIGLEIGQIFLHQRF